MNKVEKSWIYLGAGIFIVAAAIVYWYISLPIIGGYLYYRYKKKEDMKKEKNVMRKEKPIMKKEKSKKIRPYKSTKKERDKLKSFARNMIFPQYCLKCGSEIKRKFGSYCPYCGSIL